MSATTSPRASASRRAPRSSSTATAARARRARRWCSSGSASTAGTTPARGTSGRGPTCRSRRSRARCTQKPRAASRPCSRHRILRGRIGARSASSRPRCAEAIRHGTACRGTSGVKPVIRLERACRRDLEAVCHAPGHRFETAAPCRGSSRDEVSLRQSVPRSRAVRSAMAPGRAVRRAEIDPSRPRAHVRHGQRRTCVASAGRRGREQLDASVRPSRRLRSGRATRSRRPAPPPPRAASAAAPRPPAPARRRSSGCCC